MNLSKEQIQSSLKLLNIKNLNSIQLEFQSKYKNNKNIKLVSPTGSGKTIAFLLPILSSINLDQQRTQALIIVPSRELALQIDEVLRNMKTGLRIQAVYGGHSVSSEANSLLVPPHIIIGTPGRIRDHIGKENMDLQYVKTLVFDEYDKSLEFGFLDDLESIYSHLPSVNNHFLTSATSGIEIPEFLDGFEFLELNNVQEESESRFQFFEIESEEDEKMDNLLFLLSDLPFDERCIIFCNHRDAVERLWEHADETGFITTPYHGGMDQRDREKNLIKFNNGSSNILISTDLGARGLDIADVNHVIHYQQSPQKETYVHRNGRASRLNENGKIYLFSPIHEYADDSFVQFNLPNELILPEVPEWTTLYISKGKKDKVNKIDIVGFLHQIGGLSKEEIGKIDLKDRMAYVAVKQNIFNQLLNKIKDKKIKNKVVKFRKAR
jgi:superfamily II DNA/RNA helicase